MLPKRKNKQKGKSGEELAVKFLTSKGYKIIERNFRSKLGEIDIIAKDGPFLVFVEVKYRNSLRYGSPEEAVTPKKLAKIKRAAEYYTLINGGHFSRQRIDVVSILKEGLQYKIKLIKVDA